jgi:hypothetical protein
MVISGTAIGDRYTMVWLNRNGNAAPFMLDCIVTTYCTPCLRKLNRMFQIDAHAAS